jgi:hypothetical protein
MVVRVGIVLCTVRAVQYVQEWYTGPTSTISLRTQPK